MLHLLLNFLLVFTLLFAQNSRDSLENYLATENPSEREKVDLLNKIAYTYYRVDMVKIISYARQANKIATEIEYSDGLAESHRILAIGYTFQGNYDSSLVNFSIAKIIFEEVENQQGIMKVYNGLGIINFFKGDYKSALDDFHTALSLAKVLKDDHYAGSISNNIGEIYLGMYNFEKALTYFNMQLPIFIAENSYAHLGMTYINLAETHLKMGDIEKAGSYAEVGLRVTVQHHLEAFYSPIHTIKGKIYEISGEDEKALAEFQSALQYSELTPDVEYKWKAEVGIGDYYFRLGKLETAKTFYDSALKTCEAASMTEGSREAARGLQNYYEKKKDFKSAYKYLLLHQSLSDILLNESNTRKITVMEMETEFEKEKQAQQAELDKQVLMGYFLGVVVLLLAVLMIAVLSLYRTKVKTNNKLVELNSTKDRFFSIIAHDLRAPFNTLIGFANMMAKEYENMSRDEILGFIKSIENISTNSHQLLENLLDWARSQINAIQINKTELGVSELFKQNIDLLYNIAAKKRINININIAEEIKVIADKEMFNTVIRNVISNGIKFTPQGGNINAIANKVGEKIEIHIVDSGIGMDEETSNSLFRIDKHIVNTGTDNEKGTGLGLILCKEFVEKNEGKISVKSIPGEGSDFKIELPAA